MNINKDIILYALVDEDGRILDAKNPSGKFYAQRAAAERRLYLFRTGKLGSGKDKTVRLASFRLLEIKE